MSEPTDNVVISEELEISQEAVVEPTEQLAEEVVVDEPIVETIEETPKQSRNQNSKQRLQRKLREAERETARLVALDSEREKRISDLEKKLDPIINPLPNRPNLVDFETNEDYEDSLFEWRDATKNHAEARNSAVKVADTDLPPLDVPDESLKNWENQMDVASEKYDDFDDVIVSIPRASVTDAMTLAVMESKNAGEVAYFLGENHQEADRISRLSVANQIRAIDKLGDKFNNTTSAPDPISDVNHKGDSYDKTVDPDLDGMTFE